MAICLHAHAIKFNLGADPALYAMYIKHLKAWRMSIPNNIHLLCECHSGMVADTPSMAARMLREVAPQEI